MIAFFLFGIINTDSGCGIFTYVKQSGSLKAARMIDDVCYFRHAHMQGIVNFINYYYYVVYDVWKKIWTGIKVWEGARMVIL